jgi:dTDP-4-amino-4,6-dideoxygalactose transaminase
MGSSADQLAVLGGARVRTAPWPSWPAFDDETERSLMEALRSRRWAISGPYRGQASFERRFARAFADFHGVAHCTPVTNGSAALALTLRALGVGYGDRVVVPGLTWIACATSVTSVGAIPLPADIDPGSLAISQASLQRLLDEGASAVILVHPFCTVADPERAAILCNAAATPLIEDCSQAHGATWRGKRVGTFGIAGTFSMQQSKVLTCGEGGAIITDSSELAARLEQLRADGRMFVDRPENEQLELVEVGTVQGRNHCLSEFQSAILLSRLPHLDAENELRRSNAAILDRLLAAIDGVSPLIPSPETSATYYNYVLRIDPFRFAGRRVEDIAAAMSAELSLQVSPVYRPMHQHRLFNYLADPLLKHAQGEFSAVLNSFRDALPNSEAARRTCLSIPHCALLGGKGEAHDIAAALRKVQSHAAAIPTDSVSNRAF